MNYANNELATINQKKAFGKKVAELRIKKGLTQEQLASKLDYKSRNAIYNIENGRSGMPFQKIRFLADYFKVDIDYLLDNSNPAIEDYNDNNINNPIVDVSLNCDNLNPAEIEELCEYIRSFAKEYKKVKTKENYVARFISMEINDEFSGLTDTQRQLASNIILSTIRAIRNN